MFDDKDDLRSAEDRKLSLAIMDASDPETLARLVFDYYYDKGRAERTPRFAMYLHLGLLSGMIMRQARAGR